VARAMRKTPQSLVFPIYSRGAKEHPLDLAKNFSRSRWFGSYIGTHQISRGCKRAIGPVYSRELGPGGAIPATRRGST